MTDTDIRRLDETTVERIAAGEVVERPASVVKELVENSLDAGADRISVAVDGGGAERVGVTDDGVGMTEADVRAAVREHTTSKIDDVGDLEAGVTTLGFRGEALHTIGAVSRVTIRTRPQEGDAGTELRYEGGEAVAVEPAGCPPGTTVEVADLFYNTPARREFLKTEATEFARINRVVTRYALANPGVAVSLEHDGREVFATTGQGGLRAAVLSVYGREVASSMLPVAAGVPPAVGLDGDGADGDDAGERADGDAASGGDGPTGLPDGPLDGVAGYVSHPETNRSTREYVAAFVNGRYVESSAVRAAVLDAYGGQLAADRYPFVALFLSVPPGDVDVNVHPRKLSVRFEDEAGATRQVEAAVADALLSAGLVRSSAPRGRSAPEETSVAPASSGREGPDRGTDAGRADDEADAGADDGGEVNPGEAPLTPDDGSGTESRAESAGADPSRDTNRTEVDGETAEAEGTAEAEDTAETGETAGTGETDHGARGTEDPHRDNAAGSAAHAADRERPATAPDPGRKFAGGGEQTTLSGEAATGETAFESLPRLRVLGQLDDTYLVAETDDGLALVDQHAADERVNYERLREAFAGGTTAQALAAPVELELTAAEAAAFPAYREALASLGFYADRADDGDSAAGRRIEVTTVPAVLSETLAPETLRDALSSFVAAEGDGEATVDALADAFLADLACYPSVTANTSLTEGSVVDLLAALDECGNPFACPHGRPTVVRVPADEIAERFERDYPGHADRRGE